MVFRATHGTQTIKTESRVIKKKKKLVPRKKCELKSPELNIGLQVTLGTYKVKITVNLRQLGLNVFVEAFCRTLIQHDFNIVG